MQIYSGKFIWRQIYTDSLTLVPEVRRVENESWKQTSEMEILGRRHRAFPRCL